MSTESRSAVSDSFRPHGLYSPWHSPGQNNGVGSLSLLQGIFPSQGSNPGLPHCRQILYQLSHQGSPRIPDWEAYPFSSGSSQPRNRTRVSCIAGGFFTHWAIREESSCICPCYGPFILPCPSPTASTGSFSPSASLSLSCIRTILGTLLLPWRFCCSVAPSGPLPFPWLALSLDSLFGYRDPHCLLHARHLGKILRPAFPSLNTPWVTWGSNCCCLLPVLLHPSHPALAAISCCKWMVYAFSVRDSL